MESKIAVDVSLEDEQLARAQQRQTAYKQRLAAALQDERAAIEQERSKLGGQLAALSKAVSSHENTDETDMRDDDSHEEQARTQDYESLTRRVAAQMKRLEESKQQLEMELDGIMAVSRSKDADIEDKLGDLAHDVSGLQTRSQEQKAEEAADLARTLGMQDAIKKNVTTFRAEMKAKLNHMGDQIEQAARQRSQQSAALEASAQQLSQNITLQADATHELVQHLEDSDASLRAAVTAELEKKSKGALAQVDELSAQVSAVQQRSQEWAQEAADEQSKTDARLAASKALLSELTSSIEHAAAETHRRVAQVEQRDATGLHRLEHTFETIKDAANASRAELRAALAAAEDRITRKLEEQEAGVHANIAVTQQRSADSREALTAQLNSTVATVNG